MFISRFGGSFYEEADRWHVTLGDADLEARLNGGGPRIEPCNLAYSVMETPFRRDIVKEVTDAARRHNLKIDLYFSHPDWYDADFRPFAFHPLTNHVDKAEHPDQWNHFVTRHRQQLTELLTQYGKIDLVCLDMWFDQTAWLDLRETIKTIRQLQPDTMFRCRGIGNYGDYYTPEGFVPGAKENTDMPWMVIYPLAGEGIWSYEPDASKYKDGSWIVTNLVDTVAKGGNFMVGIGPDGTGRFHPTAVSQLKEVGAWLKVAPPMDWAVEPAKMVVPELAVKVPELLKAPFTWRVPVPSFTVPPESVKFPATLRRPEFRFTELPVWV